MTGEIEARMFSFNVEMLVIAVADRGNRLLGTRIFRWRRISFGIIHRAIR
jgi:hypothetical protein